MKIEYAPQVISFLRSLAPEPRRSIIRAIKGLPVSGDTKALESELEGFWRLRVKNYRVVFRYSGGQIIRCEFAESRSVVYELFAIELIKLRDF